jgi:hypothetical protein
MKKILTAMLSFFAFLLVSSAQELVSIEINDGTLESVVVYYSQLSGKKVRFSVEALKTAKISILTHNVRLTTPQAIKLIEASLYVKGFELNPQPDGALVLSRYADFDSTIQGESLESIKYPKRRIIVPSIK